MLDYVRIINFFLLIIIVNDERTGCVVAVCTYQRSCSEDSNLALERTSKDCWWVGPRYTSQSQQEKGSSLPVSYFTWMLQCICRMLLVVSLIYCHIYSAVTLNPFHFAWIYLCLSVCILCVFVSYCIIVLLWAWWGGSDGIEV